ncbi:MAG: hypothetical protein ACI9FB_001635 [Candidatus Azotimanducaceae bacterium]|jgi:hypothetical protein
MISENKDVEDQTVKTHLLADTINIFVSPVDVFESVKVNPTILYPFLTFTISFVAAYTWYFSIVDFPWLIDALLARMSDSPQEELKQIREAYDMMGSTGMMLTTNVSTVVMALLIFSVQAGYLGLISATFGDAIRFKQWFSLTIWTNIISLLSVVAIVVNIFMSENGQVSLYNINSLSLTGLGLESGGNTTLQSLFDSLSLPLFWSLGLLVAGYQHWTKSGYVKAGLIVLSPHILIYGIWAIIALS